MSKFATSALTNMKLSITATEEASRRGERTVSVDHLFLALVVDDGAAGRTLRGIGISLDAARQAVEAQHVAQLAAIGVAVAPPVGGRITFPETGGYE
ncbi:MAG: Clp protease N-terminal domain-containing protein [Propionibacteriaceae bacterium]|nr:Clp protease N-terminal domain-containing protein [Propionibacteriaceae bacterium]